MTPELTQATGFLLWTISTVVIVALVLWIIEIIVDHFIDKVEDGLSSTAYDWEDDDRP